VSSLYRSLMESTCTFFIRPLFGKVRLLLQVREVFDQTIMAEFVKHRKDLADPHLVLAYLTYVERVWVGKVRFYFEPVHTLPYSGCAYGTVSRLCLRYRIPPVLTVPYPACAYGTLLRLCLR